MAEKGILFNGDMIRAIRADAKSQTRRPMKPQPATGEVWFEHIANDRWLDAERGGSELWPPYAVGDILYCRETWRIGAWDLEDGTIAADFVDGPCMLRKECPDPEMFERYAIQCADELMAMGVEHDDEGMYHWKPGESPLRWRPGIHMPKFLAREWLKVTAVRAERVQEISFEDAHREGFVQPSMTRGERNAFDAGGSAMIGDKSIPWFIETWNACYPGSWERNDWVFVTEFERKQDGQTEGSSGAGAPGR